MTLQINDDCTSLYIAPEYWSSDNQSITFTFTINCTTVLDAITEDVTSNDFTYTPEDLSLTEFTPGVYQLQIDVVQQDGTKVREIGCVVVDCDLLCDAAALTTDPTEENIIKLLSYHALYTIPSCTSCDCSKWCILYNAATNTPCSNGTQPCGCS